MSINRRFNEIIKRLYNGNKRLFSTAIGVAPTVVENVVGTRQGKPSFDVLQKVVDANANISAEWLLTGKGSMLKVEQHELAAQPDNELIRELITKVGELSQQLGEQTKENEHLYQKNIELQSKINELKESRIGDKSTRGYSFHSDNVKSVADPERKYKRKPNI